MNRPNVVQGTCPFCGRKISLKLDSKPRDKSPRPAPAGIRHVTLFALALLLPVALSGCSVTTGVSLSGDTPYGHFGVEYRTPAAPVGDGKGVVTP